MVKKEIFTNAEIEKDIITALKNQPHTPKKSHKKAGVLGAIVGVLSVVLGVIYPPSILWMILAFIIILIGMAIINNIRYKIKTKRISVKDYSITKEVVHSTSEEHYIVKRGTKTPRFEQIDNYEIRFENGKTWRVPKDNYLWSVERPMSDFAIFNITHREDTLFVVTEKATDKIVLAYHTDFFEYKN